ncbi:28S ribosomal protein S34, mitochondrial [Scyliorhinus canicula]|uniref:28S ribosomal protein S34, mitochondrial n=1 Tax=Scyliorhinus canicula TaxID=7830 RepID=UPI0018F47E5A|nr:28S ribosomal protein S34, mitochondrial [Scyliorhinus canicula]
MGRQKRVRAIAAMARKVREYWAQKQRPRDSERYALDYETMRRPGSGKKLPVLAHRDIRNEIRLFQHLHRLPLFGIGRLFTKKSWLLVYDEPCYWTISKIKVDYTAQDMDHGKAWGVLTFRGKTEDEVKEIDKVMYHDWRLIPKHEEEAFKCFTPVPETKIRYVPYPPLLRAMILAQREKSGEPIDGELMIDLERIRHFPKDFFKNLDLKKQAEGTPV